MSTKTKIILGVVAAVFIIFVIILSVVRCNEGNEGNNEGNQNGNEEMSTGVWDDYEGVRLSFATDADCPNGNIDDTKVTNSLTFKKNVVYYMVVDFTLKAESNNDGSANAFASISFTNPSAISATVQDAASGNHEERETDGKKTIKITYSVPEKAKNEKKTRIIIKLEPKAEGESELDISFTSNEVAIKPLSHITREMAFGYTYGLEYQLSGETYTVKGIGEAKAADLVIPKAKDGHTVSAIADSAFRNCTFIKSVTVPEGVVSIGNSAFNGCAKLTEINYNAAASVNIPYENYIFSGAGSGESGLAVNIGKNVNKIPHNLFNSASKATALKFEDGSVCTEIGQNAFRGCTSFVSVSVPASVKTISDSAFYGCSSLRDLTLSEGLTNIASSAFRGCSSLITLKLPESILSIGSAAFYSCSSITSVTIPEGVTEIGNSAFNDCSAMVSFNYNVAANMIFPYDNYILSGAGSSGGVALTIGKNVKKVPDNAFNSGSNVVSLKFEEGSVCTEIGQNAFRNCSKMRSAAISEGVKIIGDSAFYGCSQLMTLSLPETLNKISGSAFRSCSSLSAVDIPESVTSIGSAAFYGCSALESITVPRNVNELGNSAFNGCSALSQVYYNATENITFPYDNYVFSGAGSSGVGLTINIGKNVKAITANMFNSGSNLINVVFEAGSACAGIGENAFRNCAKMRSISLPASIASLGANAFYGCSLLGTVNYAGTRAQWNAAVGSVNTGIPSSCTVKCSGE